MALEVFTGYERNLAAVGRSSVALNPVTEKTADATAFAVVAMVRAVDPSAAKVVDMERDVACATSSLPPRPVAGFIYPRRNC